jgi:hypothetical protein
MEALTLLLKLIFAHAVTDFALQNDSMARYKSKHNLPSVDVIPKTDKPTSFWPYFLINHGLINGAGVWLVTGSCFFACIEVVAHVIIDKWKCDSRINIHEDQFFHLVTKVWYVGLITFGM